MAEIVMTTPVYLWQRSLDCPPTDFERFVELLDADERRRAARFLRQEARDRFIVSRGLLRTVLGGFLDVDPKTLTFNYSYNGKPELIGDTDLQFNVSHSASEWCVAATLGRRLGVDLERIRPDFATIDIARRFFAPREVAELMAVPPDDQAAAFFRCWTRKEAFIKAIGAGLGFPLDEFEVSLTRDSAELRSIRGDRPKEWAMQELPAPPGYVAALAIECATIELQCNTM